MVLKGTKRSLRTGNTLRNTRDRHTNSVIVRHVTNAKDRQVTDEADDSRRLTADEVEFSLNKKGRWNLPEVIEAKIESSRTSDAAVSLLRRHRLNRQNDCLSVVTSAPVAGDQFPSDTAFQRRKARRKTYCNGLNVLHNGRGKSKKETRKKKVVSTKKDLGQRKESHAPETVPEHMEVVTPPEVRYDIFYPVPATSSLRFHPKFTASGTSYSVNSEQNLAVTANVKPSRGSHQRCKHVDYDDLYGYDDYYDDWTYDEEDYYEDGNLTHTERATADDCDHDESRANTSTGSLFLYSDYVEQAFEVAMSCSTTIAGTVKRSSRRTRPRKKRGGRFFYTPETENEVDSCLDDSQSDTSMESDTVVSVSPQPSVIKFPQMPSVVVELSGKATCAQWLTEQYGLRYSEAVCSPRKIVLDITDRVQAAMRSVSTFNDIFLPSLDLTTYIIFTYICPSAQTPELQNSCQSSTNVGLYDVFSLQLNMNCLAQGLSLCLQGTSQFDNVDDVLDQVLNFLITLSPENLARHPCEASASILKSRFTPNFSTVAEANGWTASCVSLLDEEATSVLPLVFPYSPMQPRNVFDQEEGHNPCSYEDNENSQESQFPDSKRDHHVKPFSEMYCHICFSEILPDSREGPQATALTQCQHWFCDTCWQCHLSVAMQDKGGRKLQCPEFQCHAEVDLGTLLSLQNVRDVTLHQRRLAEGKLMRMFLCKWCPNPHCGRVVKLAASSSSTTVAEPTSMSCPCGHQFCLRCHGDPHWPLNCEDLPEYHAILRKNDLMATMGETMVVVRGKPCPSCNRFIEKSGGCPYMACICGHRFWWCCRKPTIKNHDCLKYYSVNDKTNTTKKVVRERIGARAPHLSEWYEMAVRHRAFQRSRYAKNDYKRAEQLCKKLLSLCAKGVDIGVFSALPENSSAAQPENPASLKSDSAGDRLHPRRTDAKEKARSEGRTVLKIFSMSTPTTREVTRQYVQQTTFDMIKLKMELQNVLENTAAFLHLHAHGSESRGSATVSKVKDTVDLLQFFVSTLDGLLAAEGRRQLSQALPAFRGLKRYVKDTMITLTNILNK